MNLHPMPIKIQSFFFLIINSLITKRKELLAIMVCIDYSLVDSQNQKINTKFFIKKEKREASERYSLVYNKGWIFFLFYLSFYFN